jgi:hypothetical protein
MRWTRGGRFLALLLLPALAPAAFAETLFVLRETGDEIARFDVPDGTEWCILWNHSVKGFEVSDCYENRNGRMVLVWSHLPDFAAGLDHIPGRGQQVSDGQGGYLILGIDEPVPGNAYVLRPGAGPVDHRLKIGDRVVSLSAVATHERVTITLIGTNDQ